MTVRAQNHIHLQPTAEKPGGGWSVDGVPDEIYKVVFDAASGGEVATPRPVAESIRGVNGKLHYHVIETDGGDPVIVYDYTLRIKVDSHSEREQLYGSLGKVCDFVPNWHGDDGEDSSGHIKSVVFSQVTEEKQLSQDQEKWTISVRLEDNSI